MEKENRHINMIINYAERNLSLELDTKILGEMGYISRAKLYRDFYSSIGYR